MNVPHALTPNPSRGRLGAVAALPASHTAARLIRGVPALLAALLLASASFAEAQSLRARAAVASQSVYVGESFAFQIQIDGSDAPDKPGLSAISGFEVQEAGGQQNSSQSISIVNGRTTRTVRRGYVFSYQLTAQKAGTFTIPSITVTAEGQTAQTAPIRIVAQPPAQSNDLKLVVSLSESEAYVGQPVTLTVTWYVGLDVREHSWDLPVLEDKRFEITGSDPAIDPQDRDNYLGIQAGGKQIIATKGRGTLNGREFLTVKFHRVLTPKQSGRLTLPKASITCKAVQGYRSGRRSMLDDFFGDSPFGGGIFGRQPVLQTVVVPSNTPALQVAELPTRGRPANFSGLIGSYSMSASAAPAETSVGDPITLSLRVSGPSHLGNVTLPPLHQQPSLARDFKVPAERAAGTVKGRAKIFTQTLRAKHSGVTEIPPIELSYFDPDTAQYATARTEPIPLSVKGAKIVTARDVEGADAGDVMQSELETLEGGITANYQGLDALQNQPAGPAALLASPLVLALVWLPPLAYFGLLGFVLISRRQGDSPERRARRAFGHLSKELRTVAARTGANGDNSQEVLEALRRYLGARLRLSAAAMTFADARAALERSNADPDTVAELGKVFETCEAGRYAGAASQESVAETARQALAIAEKLEGSLK